VTPAADTYRPDRVVLRAVPAGQTQEERMRFEFARTIGAWEWTMTRPGPGWERLAALTVAGRLGPASSLALPERRARAWCAPRDATGVLGALRHAGHAEAMTYRMFAEDGHQLTGDPRLVSGAASTLSSPVTGAEKRTTPPERHEPALDQSRPVQQRLDDAS